MDRQRLMNKKIKFKLFISCFAFPYFALCYYFAKYLHQAEGWGSLTCCTGSHRVFANVVYAIFFFIVIPALLWAAKEGIKIWAKWITK
jgi:hypothetical protein